MALSGNAKSCDKRTAETAGTAGSCSMNAGRDPANAQLGETI